MIQLAGNETMIFQEVGVFITIHSQRSSYPVSLYLTNERIAYQRNPSFFGKTFPVYSHELKELKTFRGIPQIKQGRYPNGCKSMDLYFTNGEFLQFYFNMFNNATITKWIYKVCEMFGCKPTDDNLNKLKRRPDLENSLNSPSANQTGPVLLCPDCNRTLPLDSVFCAFCGKRLEKEQKSISNEERNTLFCKECGKELSITMKYCTGCGAAIKDSWR